MMDVAIVGAGPAGSAAAIELARAGKRVLIIEKKPFPRTKVCGGCLSGPAASRLTKLVGEGRELPGIPGTQVSFVIGSYRLACHPHGATRIIPREEMDACLANLAAEAGAEIRYGQAASLHRGDGDWHVVVGGERIRARWILIASGLSGLATRIGIRNSCRSRPMIAQQWVQPAGSSLPLLGSVELHWLHGGYVGLATPRMGDCVIALACDAPGDSGDSAWDRLRRLNPGAPIWQSLPADAPKRFAAKGTAGFPWIPDRLGDANALVIGDAAGYAEPYSGEGIGQALCSAACAVQALLKGGDVLNGYADQMRRLHARTVRRTSWIRSILRTPIVRFIAAQRPLIPRRWLASLVESVHIKGAA